MIRLASPTDLPRLVAMGQRFIAETDYQGHIANNPDAIQTFMAGLLGNECALVLVSARDGAVVGMFAAFCFIHPMSGEFIASEAFWWVEPEHRGDGVRLLRAGERWAVQQGATRMQMIAPTAQVGRVYQRFGYTPVETTYERTLAP